MTYFGLEGLNTLKYMQKQRAGWREGVRNGNCSLHKESLGCVRISQELESKLIVGPYTEHREVLFKEQNALGQS